MPDVFAQNPNPKGPVPIPVVHDSGDEADKLLDAFLEKRMGKDWDKIPKSKKFVKEVGERLPKDKGFVKETGSALVKDSSFIKSSLATYTKLIGPIGIAIAFAAKVSRIGAIWERSATAIKRGAEVSFRLRDFSRQKRADIGYRARQAGGVPLFGQGVISDFFGLTAESAEASAKFLEDSEKLLKEQEQAFKARGGSARAVIAEAEAGLRRKLFPHEISAALEKAVREQTAPVLQGDIQKEYVKGIEALTPIELAKEAGIWHFYPEYFEEQKRAKKARIELDLRQKAARTATEKRKAAEELSERHKAERDAVESLKLSETIRAEEIIVRSIFKRHKIERYD